MDIKTLAEKLQYVALYTAIAIIASCIVVGLLVWFFKREKFNDFKKYAIGIVTGFAATMLVVFSYVMFQRNINKMQAMLFYPILAMLIVVVAGGIAVLISSLFSNKAAKISLIVTAYCSWQALSRSSSLCGNTTTSIVTNSKKIIPV